MATCSRHDHGAHDGRAKAPAPRSLPGMVLKAPILAYRYTFKAFFGWHCRHLPTCSEYALEAIDVNGPWRGLWLTASRLVRCRPGGTAGYDAVPDITAERHLAAPWRYGRWTGAHMDQQWTGPEDAGR